MNGDLFKITLISVIAILLAIVGGLVSADGDPVSIALAIAPFALAALYMMKEKVWYLWILIPPLFIPFSINSYAPLFAYSVVLPFYLWNVMLRRSSLTWNSIPLLDTLIFLLFIHVAYVFLTHPFGLGINILEDYYGGKGYIMFLQALLAYVCLSSLKTNSQDLGKVLQWSIALILFFTLVQTARALLSPESGEGMEGSAGGGTNGDTRNSSFLAFSVLVLQVLILKYSAWQMIKRPWWGLLAVSACAGILISGFRSSLAVILLLFFIVSLLYKRWFVSIVAPILGLGILMLFSSSKTLLELPFGVQRVLSVLPFLEVSSQAREDAMASIQWRVEMWAWAFDDREKFIQDKVFGDGFARDINILKANIYEEAYHLTNSNQISFAWNGLWHSGPVSTIQTIGYVGLTLYFIISIIGMVYAWQVGRIYRYSKYSLGILFVTAIYLTRPLGFFFIFGESTSITEDIISLGIIKVLFSCAKREGLYVSIHMRREYVPLMIQQKKEKAALPSPSGIPC